MAKDDDLQEKIKTFMVKLDKMESRVKEMETLSATIPKLAEKLEKVETRVTVTEKRVEAAPMAAPVPSPPTPVKAFVSGASIGLVIIGTLAVAWLLGFF